MVAKEDPGLTSSKGHIKYAPIYKVIHPEEQLRTD